MDIKSGTHRVTILISSLAIKLPRLLRPIDLLKYTIKHCRSGELRLAAIDVKFAISVFRDGVRENWNEFKCWKELKANFLVPTYFSLFGLLNIQQISKGKNITNEELTQIWIKIARKTEREILKTDYHTIANRENYHRYEGAGLKLLDYGGARKFINKWYKVFEEVLKVSNVT